MRQVSDGAAVRHGWPDRLFHWAMAVAVIIELLSAFLPIAGIKFDWIPWHWIAGVCLTVLLIFHIVRVLFVQALSSMLPAWRDVRQILGKPLDSPGPQPKYDGYQKSYHWLVALVVIALVVTGLAMLFKLDTPFWNRNPGILSDLQWGYVYVIHGLCSLALIFLALVHIYFALLPEHRPLLQSMIKGGNPRFAAPDWRAGTIRGETR